MPLLMSAMKSDQFTRSSESVEYIKSLLPVSLQKPRVGIICGSGLGGLTASVRSDRDTVDIPYGSIPHFPQSTVRGHAGKLLFGFLGPNSIPVVLMVGRIHFYEGHTMQETSMPIRLMKLLGIEILLVTNAAGGLNTTYEVGDLVVLGDHLNLAGLSGTSPLIGPNSDEFGERFTSLSDAYDLNLRRTAFQTWEELSPQKVNPSRQLHEGVYAYSGGPSYETRAECRMLRVLGADVVGMSTVPEIIVARHCGIRVLAISLVTNKVVYEAGPKGDDPGIINSEPETLAASLAAGKANHEEVLRAGVEAAKDLQLLVFHIVNKLLTE